MGLMALMSKVLGFRHTESNGAKVSEVTVDPGGGANISGLQHNPPGVDSQPLPGDLVLAVPVQGTGKYDIIGYVDLKNDQKSGPGEHRIYARDADGNSVAEIWFKSDGTVETRNDNGYSQLKSNGEVEANGATVDTTGDCLTAPAISGVPPTFGRVSTRHHTHISAAPGSATTPPVPVP